MRTAQASQARADAVAEQLESRDVVKLIRKLRWIGMEREAEELQTILYRVPAEERVSCLADPDSTD